MPTRSAHSAAESSPALRSASCTASAVSGLSPLGRLTGGDGAAAAAPNTASMSSWPGRTRSGERELRGAERLQPDAEVLVVERLDQVVDRSPGRRGPDRVGLARGGHHQHPDVVATAPQPPQHVDAGHVGQVHVEQHQVGSQPGDVVERGLAAAGDPDDDEALACAPRTGCGCARP